MNLVEEVAYHLKNLKDRPEFGSPEFHLWVMKRGQEFLDENHPNSVLKRLEGKYKTSGVTSDEYYVLVKLP